MEHDDGLYQQALAQYERGELDAARQGFAQLLATRPDCIQARYKLANVLKEQGDIAAAEVHYRAVLERAPAHAEALNNLGTIHQAGDRQEAAEACYRQALAAKPALAPPYLNLGRLLQGQGREAEAAILYGQALQHGLDAEVFGHLQAAANGALTPRAPPSYVRETFDAFAGEFDRRLVAQLGYRVPERLADMLAGQEQEPAQGRLEVLDLGCGTGLVGDALAQRALAQHAVAPRLTGVDLSAQMLAAAQRKGRYQALHQADIAEWLEHAPPAAFDLVVAADVFIYIGELSAVFAAVRRTLRRGGLFAFSVERCDEGDYRLLPSGRYAQSAAYIDRLGREWGLHCTARTPTDIRAGVAGELYLLQAG